MRSLFAKPLHPVVTLPPLATVAEIASLARAQQIAGKWPWPHGGCPKL